VDEHPRKPEGDLFGILVSLLSHLETVTKVNVHNFARDLVQQEVARVPIAQTEDVPDHRVDAETASVGDAALEPGFRVSTPEPEDAVQVLARGVVQGVLEHLDLVQERQTVVAVVGHLQGSATPCDACSSIEEHARY
jgi:hypothetical protein